MPAQGAVPPIGHLFQRIGAADILNDLLVAIGAAILAIVAVLGIVRLRFVRVAVFIAIWLGDIGRRVTCAVRFIGKRPWFVGCTLRFVRCGLELRRVAGFRWCVVVVV